MIIPAIDLIKGEVVRLVQGDFNQKTMFSVDPLEKIREAAEQGATFMHIVDLDGARNPDERQLELIRTLVRSSPIPMEVGGGIREEIEVEALLNYGVERVVIGSAAVKNSEDVHNWFNRFGAEHITLALDVQMQDGLPYVATNGWTEISLLTLDELISTYADVGLKHVLITDISRDGMMGGPNVELYTELATHYPKLKIIASGGISSLEDITAVARSGVDSVVLGRALLEGRFSVEEAIACWQNA